MNCRLCQQGFSLYDEKSVPRVLIQCGHTFCHGCISKNLKNGQLKCQQCNKVNFSQSINKFPVNQTLIALLKNNKSPDSAEKQSSFREEASLIDEEEMCRIHQKRLQAYCQKENELLCLNCVLSNQHKNHKITSVSQKVEKDKDILKKCHNKIKKSLQDNQQKRKQSLSLIEQINLDYKQYEFQINLLFNNIQAQILQQQHKLKSKAQESAQRAIKNIQHIQSQLTQTKTFLINLEKIYEEVIYLSDLKYLGQDNKRIFIVQNCYSKTPNLQYSKIELNKLSVLQSTVCCLEELVNFEKKKNVSRKKSSNNLEKSKDKELVALGGVQESPSRFQKKISSKSAHCKEPQILEVNLSQQYQKHKQNKGVKKITNIMPQQNSLSKPTKIQYEIRRENSKPNQEKPGKSLKDSGKVLQKQKISEKDKFTISKRSELSASIFDSQCFSPTNNYEGNEKSFSLCTPMSIKSFMSSSRFTVKDSLKDSRSSFTINNFEQRVYHFGGLVNQSATCYNLHQGKIEQLAHGINRNKCQCAMIQKYSNNKILILGGKDSNGERTSSILQFDIITKVIKKSLLSLENSLSGFGAVTMENKLYIFGGSSSSPSNWLTEYQIGKVGFQSKRLASMISCRDQLGFALGYDGFLYACGGINSSNTILNSCERYDFAKNKWFSIAPMKTARRSFSMVSLPNGIFAVGGHNGKSFLNKVQMFDYQTGKWMDVAPMNQARFAHTCIATNDYQSIIVFGGFENQALKTVEKFNLIENKWSKMPDMDKVRFLHCSIFLQE